MKCNRTPGDKKIQKALQMEQSIQEWTSKFCARQPLKNLKGYGLLIHFSTIPLFC